MIPQLTTTAWLRFNAIRRAFALAAPATVLEVGSGQGALGAWIAAHHRYTGIERDDASRAVAASRLEARGCGRVLGELTEADARRYDLVCAFEVLEHTDDDRKTLATWRERLVPRGFLLLSVPAHADRFGPADEYVGHFRRYDRSVLRERLEAEGFEVVRWRAYGAGLGQLLDAARNAILRRRQAAPAAEERTAASGRLFQPRGRVGALVNYLVALPFRLLQAPLARTDVGVGYVVLARLR